MKCVTRCQDYEMDPVICGIPQVHIDLINKIKNPTSETTHSCVI